MRFKTSSTTTSFNFPLPGLAMVRKPTSAHPCLLPLTLDPLTNEELIYLSLKYTQIHRFTTLWLKKFFLITVLKGYSFTLGCALKSLFLRLVTSLQRDITAKDQQLLQLQAEAEKLRTEIQDKDGQLAAMSAKFSRMRESREQQEELVSKEKELVTQRH
eukprot:g36385.t1